MLAILGIILGGAALAIALTRSGETAPLPETYIPSADEIGMSRSIAELNTYYDLLNELYLSGEIDQFTYTELYSAYEEKYYELIGGS